MFFKSWTRSILGNIDGRRYFLLPGLIAVRLLTVIRTAITTDLNLRIEYFELYLEQGVFLKIILKKGKHN